MEYNRYELAGISWYNLLHWDSIRTAYYKHQTVIQSDQERSSTALLRLHSRSGKWFWVHCVLQVKDTSEECQHPIIVCTNQVLKYVAMIYLTIYKIIRNDLKFSVTKRPKLCARVAGCTNIHHNRNSLTAFVREIKTATCHTI